MSRRHRLAGAAFGAALMAAHTAGALAAPLHAAPAARLSVHATQKTVKPGKSMRSGRTRVISGELEKGSFSDGHGGGILLTELTTRSSRRAASVSGASLAIFSDRKRGGLCLTFRLLGRGSRLPTRGRFRIAGGIGSRAGAQGKGRYRLARRRDGWQTTLKGKVRAGRQPLSSSCKRLFDQAPAGLLPSTSTPTGPVGAPGGPSPGSGGPKTIEAGGDIACPGGNPPMPPQMGPPPTTGSCQQQATSDLLLGPLDGVITLGDNQYNDGTLAEYTTGARPFDKTWGRVKPRIYPTPGNHEYRDTMDNKAGGAAGYFSYFGSGAAHDPGAPGQGWYSFDLGSWHILSLNANCNADKMDVGDLDATNSGNGCRAGSPQEAWVRRDLAAHAKGSGGPSCIMAFWHEPLYSSDPQAVQPKVDGIWQDLYDARADVVLNGHAHLYERFAPQNAHATADPAGMREFIVGTGGEDLYGSTPPPPFAANSERFNNNTFGVLRMTLSAGSYSWQFVPVAGSSSGFTDTGSQNCHF